MIDFMWFRCEIEMMNKKFKWWCFENMKNFECNCVNNKKYWTMFLFDSKKRMNDFHIIQMWIVNNE